MWFLMPFQSLLNEEVTSKSIFYIFYLCQGGLLTHKQLGEIFFEINFMCYVCCHQK